MSPWCHMTTSDAKERFACRNDNQRACRNRASTIADGAACRPAGRPPQPDQTTHILRPPGNNCICNESVHSAAAADDEESSSASSSRRAVFRRCPTTDRRRPANSEPSHVRPAADHPRCRSIILLRVVSRRRRHHDRNFSVFFSLLLLDLNIRRESYNDGRIAKHCKFFLTTGNVLWLKKLYKLAVHPTLIYRKRPSKHTANYACLSS